LVTQNLPTEAGYGVFLLLFYSKTICSFFWTAEGRQASVHTSVSPKIVWMQT